MWSYDKNLLYPVRVAAADPAMAARLIKAYGGAFGRAARYLTQRYAMPTDQTRALLTDVATEELAHVEMLGTMVHRLSDGAAHDRTVRVEMPMMWAGGDGYGLRHAAATLLEAMAAEQRAALLYEALAHDAADEGVRDALGFLCERELVHAQRFGEALHNLQALADA